MANKARKVLFTVKSYTSDLSQIPVKVSCNIFDTLIQPILTYNAEISFMDHYLKYYRAKIRAQHNNSEIDVSKFIDKTPFEKLHIRFCKNTLGTKRCSSNLATRAELDRLPIESFIKTQAIVYLARLSSNNINPLLKEAFQLSKKLDNDGTYSWYTFAKNTLKEINLEEEQLANWDTVKKLGHTKILIKNSVNDYNKNISTTKIENLTEDNKLFLYKSIKITNNEPEFYLKHPNKRVRQNITRFRISDHKLSIETGRY